MGAAITAAVAIVDCFKNSRLSCIIFGFIILLIAINLKKYTSNKPSMIVFL
jgi:hypothetical protein